MAKRKSTPTPAAASCFEDGMDGTPIPGTPAPVPCPFCGSGASGTDSMLGVFKHAGPSTFSVQCQQCGAEGPSGTTQREAAERWNARSAPAAEPSNPLIQDQAGDTLANVAALLTWIAWHPLDKETVPAEHVAEELALADYQLQTMLRDAVRHEAKRSGV